MRFLRCASLVLRPSQLGSERRRLLARTAAVSQQLASDLPKHFHVLGRLDPDHGPVMTGSRSFNHRYRDALHESPFSPLCRSVGDSVYSSSPRIHRHGLFWNMHYHCWIYRLFRWIRCDWFHHFVRLCHPCPCAWVCDLLRKSFKSP